MRLASALFDLLSFGAVAFALSIQPQEYTGSTALLKPKKENGPTLLQTLLRRRSSELDPNNHDRSLPMVARSAEANPVQITGPIDNIVEQSNSHAQANLVEFLEQAARSSVSREPRKQDALGPKANFLKEPHTPNTNKEKTLITTIISETEPHNFPKNVENAVLHFVHKHYLTESDMALLEKHFVETGFNHYTTISTSKLMEKYLKAHKTKFGEDAPLESIKKYQKKLNELENRELYPYPRFGEIGDIYGNLARNSANLNNKGKGLYDFSKNYHPLGRRSSELDLNVHDRAPIVVARSAMSLPSGMSLSLDDYKNLVKVAEVKIEKPVVSTVAETSGPPHVNVKISKLEEMLAKGKHAPLSEPKRVLLRKAAFERGYSFDSKRPVSDIVYEYKQAYEAEYNEKVPTRIIKEYEEALAARNYPRKRQRPE